MKSLPAYETLRGGRLLMSSSANLTSDKLSANNLILFIFLFPPVCLYFFQRRRKREKQMDEKKSQWMIKKNLVHEHTCYELHHIVICDIYSVDKWSGRGWVTARVVTVIPIKDENFSSTRLSTFSFFAAHFRRKYNRIGCRLKCGKMIGRGKKCAEWK